jgi:predicted transposase YbfD/YdcC
MRSGKGRKKTKLLISDRIGLETQPDQIRKRKQMQYSESVVECLKNQTVEHPEGLDWQRACSQIPDPRRKQGTRFSLLSILLLAVAAMLCNHLSELAIAEWGAGQSEEVKHALGFVKGVTPHQSTIQRLFRRLNAEEVERAYRTLFLPEAQANRERGASAVSIDGKAHKGRLPFEEKQGYPVHAVSLVAHDSGVVLSQGHVDKGDMETASPAKGQSAAEVLEDQKQKSELAVAARLIPQLDWNGRVLTGDALYCQRSVCAALRQAGGDYLFLVKGNQPQLLEDIRLLFAPPAPAKRAGEGVLRLPEQTASTQDQGHGRVETRSIRVSSQLKGYSDWPGLEHVFELRRSWQSKGVCKEAVRYGVTSLPAPLALPERLLTLKRGHWTIENGLHYVKDVSMGEDKSTVHLDNGPKIMMALRNLSLSLLRCAGYSAIAARLRYHSTHPLAALELLFENA